MKIYSEIVYNESIQWDNIYTENEIIYINFWSIIVCCLERYK